MQWYFIIICGMVIFLECLDVLSNSVTIDTYVKWLPRLSISKGTDKVTYVFSIFFHWHISNFYLYIISPPSVCDRDLLSCNYFLQCYKNCCIVETINPRIWYKAMWDPAPFTFTRWVKCEIRNRRNADNIHWTWIFPQNTDNLH